MTKPLSPDEVKSQAGNSIPDSIIDAVNSLLKKKFDGKSATINQNDIIYQAILNDGTLSKEKIFKENWLNFELLFERAGWIVTYDKPGYNETYIPTFKFRKA